MKYFVYLDNKIIESTSSFEAAKEVIIDSYRKYPDSTIKVYTDEGKEVNV